MPIPLPLQPCLFTHLTLLVTFYLLRFCEITPSELRMYVRKNVCVWCLGIAMWPYTTHRRTKTIASTMFVCLWCGLSIFRNNTANFKFSEPALRGVSIRSISRSCCCLASLQTWTQKTGDDLWEEVDQNPYCSMFKSSTEQQETSDLHFRPSVRLSVYLNLRAVNLGQNYLGSKLCTRHSKLSELNLEKSYS